MSKLDELLEKRRTEIRQHTADADACAKNCEMYRGYIAERMRVEGVDRIRFRKRPWWWPFEWLTYEYRLWLDGDHELRLSRLVWVDSHEVMGGHWSEHEVTRGSFEEFYAFEFLTEMPADVAKALTMVEHALR